VLRAHIENLKRETIKIIPNGGNATEAYHFVKKNYLTSVIILSEKLLKKRHLLGRSGRVKIYLLENDSFEKHLFFHHYINLNLGWLVDLLITVGIKP